MMLERILASLQVMRFDFELVNMPDGTQTAKVLGSVDSTEYPPLPANAKIFAVTGRANAALTNTGAIMPDVTSNGSAVGFNTTAVFDSTHQSLSLIKSPEQGSYVPAGNRLGLATTKTGTVGTTTVDSIVSVYAVVGDFEV